MKIIKGLRVYSWVTDRMGTATGDITSGIDLRAGVVFDGASKVSWPLISVLSPGDSKN